MRLTRVHVDEPLAVGREIALPDSAAAHLGRVLRLGVGDACVLFNGDGHDYAARIVAMNKRELRVAIDSMEPVTRESPLKLVLLQGVARGEKMDLILQKATELGVASVIPVMAERTEVKLDADRTEKRMAHWRSVIASACEQSGRARLPSLAVPTALGDAAQAVDHGATKLTLDPTGDVSLATVKIDAAAVVVAIGPEGGWSPRDRDTLSAAGFIGLRLGPRILRTETAGLAAIAALQSRFGDL